LLISPSTFTAGRAISFTVLVTENTANMDKVVGVLGGSIPSFCRNATNAECPYFHRY